MTFFRMSDGLDEKWAHNIIEGVGSYDEIFERNVGSGAFWGIAV